MLTAAWRLVIVCCAALAALSWVQEPLSLRTFTVQANLLIALCFAWLLVYPVLTRRPEPPSAAIRGAVLVTALTMTLIFFAEGGDGAPFRSLLAHLITTVLVLADWLLVGRRQAALRWWHPVAWLAYPVAYLALTLLLGAVITERWRRYQYPFLDPTSAGFAVRIAVFAVLIVLLGYLVLGLGRLRRGRAGRPDPRADRTRTAVINRSAG